MSYTFGFDAEFMRGMNADPELRKQMLTNAFAADMKVASVKMEQLTAQIAQEARRRRDFVAGVAGGRRGGRDERGFNGT